MKSFRSWSLGVVGLLCLILMAHQALAVTPAGTVIGNAATAQYTDEENNEYTTTSNIVQTVVLPICAVEVLVNQTAFDVAPDQELYVPVEVRNNSNTTRTYSLATGGIGTYTTTIYRDSNQNGEVDPGEPALAADVELNMDETAYFVVMVEVPAVAGAGDTNTFNVTATATDELGVPIVPACDATSDDVETTVVNDALIVANKQVDYTVSQPGGVLTYTIRFQNIGTQAARSVTGWSIDGNPTDGILVSDELPTDTIFNGGTTPSGQPSNGDVVYSDDGTNWHTAVGSVPGGTNADVRYIGFFIPDSDPPDNGSVEDVLAVDQQGNLTFEVLIDDPFNDPGDLPAVPQDEASRVDNQATVEYNDSTDTTPETTDTNWVHTTVPSSSTADISVGGLNDWTHSGNPGDPWVTVNTNPVAEEDGTFNDDNYASNVPAGSWITFEHQVSNNDVNNDDVISLYFDPTLPNLPIGAIVELWNADGTIKLIDTDADGNVDLGTVAAGDTKDFIVKVFIPSSAVDTSDPANGVVDYYVDIQAISDNNSAETDLTRDNIDGILAPGVDIAERGDAGDGADDPSDGNTVAPNDRDDILPDPDLATDPGVTPGETKYYELQLVNTGESPDTYSLSAEFTDVPTGATAPEDMTFRFLIDPDCSLDTNGEPNGDEYEVVDTPLLGGSVVTDVIDADTIEVANTASFKAGDSVIVGLSGTELTIDTVNSSTKQITTTNNHGASVGDLVSESICIILAVDTDTDTSDGDYNIVVNAESSLNPNVSNDMDVFMRVAAICGVSITPDHSDQLPPGGTTTYQHTVSNNGNYDLAVRITLTPPGASLLNYRILDSAGAEVGGTTYDIATLAEGASETFYVKVFASSTTPIGTVEELVLTADAYAVGDLGGAVICTDVSKDTTTIIEGFLLLEKEFDTPIPDHDGYDYANDRCYDDADGVIDGTDAQTDGVPNVGVDDPDSAGPCDIVTYQIRYTNIGEQDAFNVKISDSIPENTDYVPDSLSIDTACGFGGVSKTDGPGDDEAEYDAVLNSVTFRVGTGADATDGGTVQPDETGCVVFQVRIK